MCLKMQESSLKVGYAARVLVRVLFRDIYFTNSSLSNGQNAPPTGISVLGSREKTENRDKFQR